MNWHKQMKEAVAENKQWKVDREQYVKDRKKGKRRRKRRASGKGAAFERLFSKELSLWWSGGTDDHIFWRTQASGGRATSRYQKGKHTYGNYGDIKAENPSGRQFTKVFTIELKTGYKGQTLEDLLEKPRKSPGWRSWLTKAKEDCSKAKSLSWMLVVKKNGRKPLVALPSLVFKTLCKIPIAKIKNKAFIFSGLKNMNSGKAVIIMPMAMFFKYVTVEAVKKLSTSPSVPCA